MNSDREIKTAATTNSSQVDAVDHLSVFIFSIGDYMLAIDAEQVFKLSIPSISLENLTPEATFINQNSSEPLISLAYILKEPIASFVKPRIVKFHFRQKLVATVIEEPRLFRTVLLTEIHPMPKLINHLRGNHIMWGMFEFEEDIVYLMDLHRIEGIIFD